MIYPHSKEPVSEVLAGAKADVDRAVAAAREAFDHGPRPHMAQALAVDAGFSK